MRYKKDKITKHLNSDKVRERIRPKLNKKWKHQLPSTQITLHLQRITNSPYVEEPHCLRINAAEINLDHR